jgi:RNA polymerase sigma-70 factor (ECF subfamily)
MPEQCHQRPLGKRDVTLVAGWGTVLTGSDSEGEALREGDELVARAKNGDEVAWAELYADHAERLVVWLGHLHQLDAAVDAEDIAAEAWLTAARRIGDFSGTRSDFAGWLFSIARNISRNRYRTTRSRGTAPLAPLGMEDVIGSTDDHARGVAGDDHVRRLVASLPEREAQVIACIDVVGLDVATTARALDLSPGAVRVAHHRGLRRLRRLLSRHEAAGPASDVTPRRAREM